MGLTAPANLLIFLMGLEISGDPGGTFYPETDLRGVCHCGRSPPGPQLQGVLAYHPRSRLTLGRRVDAGEKIKEWEVPLTGPVYALLRLHPCLSLYFYP